MFIEDKSKRTLFGNDFYGSFMRHVRCFRISQSMRSVWQGLKAAPHRKHSARSLLTILASNFGIIWSESNQMEIAFYWLRFPKFSLCFLPCHRLNSITLEGIRQSKLFRWIESFRKRKIELFRLENLTRLGAPKEFNFGVTFANERVVVERWDLCC